MTYDEINQLIQNWNIPELALTYNWVVVANGGLFPAHCLSLKHNKRLDFVDPLRMAHTTPDCMCHILLIDDIFNAKQVSTIQGIYPEHTIHTLALFELLSDSSKPTYSIVKVSTLPELPWNVYEEQDLLSGVN